MSFFKPNIAAMKAKRDLAGLLNALKGKDAQIRRETIKALGDLGAHSAVPVLAELLLVENFNVPEKTDLAQALGKIGDEAAIDALVQANRASHTRERKRIEHATSSPDRRYHEGFYITQISTDEYLFRSAIANAFANLASQRAVNILFEMLATESGQMANQVRNDIQQAIQTVLEKHPAEMATWLNEYLQHGSVDVRLCATHLLGALGDVTSTGMLVEVACDDNEDFRVRQVALMGLGQIGDRSALPALEALMRSGNRGLARDAEMSAARIRERHPYISNI